MNKHRTNAEIIKERRMLLESHRCRVTPEMEVFKLTEIDFIRGLSVNGGRSYSSIELNRREMTSHYSAYNNRLCYPVANASCTAAWEQADNLTHPEDLVSIYKAEIIFYNLLMLLPSDKKKHLTMWYLRRMKNKAGGYDIYLVSVYMVLADALGMPWLLRVESEYIQPWKFECFYPYRRFVFWTTPEMHDAKQLDAENDNELTPQELVVLQHAVAGNSIKKSALTLKVSENTIKSHRAHVMQKLNCVSLSIACLLAQRMKICE